MKRAIHRYRISDLVDYINWGYFFHAWGIPFKFASVADVHGCDSCRAMWASGFAEDERPKANEAVRLMKEAERMLSRLEPYMRIGAVVKLLEANADGDDIIVEGGVRLPMLRQQVPDKSGYCLCLSDYVRPLSSKVTDTIGIFATSVDADISQLFGDDDYSQMLAQTLADRLAEAAAERFHEEVRKDVWGYAADEQLTIAQLHREEYIGIRPAVGYPCLPDISLNFILDSLCDYTSIGVRLTEHGMMMPHASVSGLMISHPAAKYFSVGLIDDTQIADYAIRRGMTVDEVRKYIHSTTV